MVSTPHRYVFDIRKQKRLTRELVRLGQEEMQLDSSDPASIYYETRLQKELKIVEAGRIIGKRRDMQRRLICDTSMFKCPRQYLKMSIYLF